MSKFEKLVIPLIDDCITSMDLTSVCGFIDSYTTDDDKPSAECEFFLAYDSTIRNEYTAKRSERFNRSHNLKRKYIKIVNNKAIMVYVFWVTPEIKKFYNGVLVFTSEQKTKILRFWEFENDVANTVLNNSVIHTNVKHSVPLEDYNESFWDSEDGGIIIDKGRLSQMRQSPFFSFYSVMNPINRIKLKN